MKEFDNIKDMVYCELDEISRQEKLDMSSMKVIGELVDILKDIGSIEMFEEGINIQEDDYQYGNGGYSRNGMGGGYSQRRMPIYYNDGNSYRGGGNSYRGNGGYSRRGRYSYDDSKQHMVEKLTHMMNEATDPKDRDAIQRLIDQMEQ